MFEAEVHGEFRIQNPAFDKSTIFQSLCDGKLYEIMRGNFERADRTSVIRTTVNSKVGLHLQIVSTAGFLVVRTV